MSLVSMTGFAARTGQHEATEWQWEARSVNARGLDLRIRLPDGMEPLEPVLRTAAQKALSRGAVQVTLRVGAAEGPGRPTLDPAALERAVAAAAAAQAAAESASLPVAPMSAAEILSLRGVYEPLRAGARPEGLQEAVAADIPALIADLAAARAAEGAALARVLGAQIDRIESLVGRAADAARARAPRQRANLRARVAELVAAESGVPEERLAQELALLVVKADVTEELDRLRAHVAAARALTAEGGAVGRRLDFLTQEFNREANTLCAKAADADLTAAGLEMKVVVDQMREQCQNVE